MTLANPSNPLFRIDGMMEINDTEFRNLSNLIYKHFGISLTEAKRSLLVRRLQNLLKELQFSSFKEYYQYLVNHPNDKNFTELVNRITTNYTFFNREPAHFEYFTRVVLPQISRDAMNTGLRDLRVWCAAASTGEEPYMLSILMQEFFGVHYTNWDAGVLATDISQRALDKAVLARYSADEFDHMPPLLVSRYFTKLNDGTYTVKDKLKRDITYRRFNLNNDAYPFKKPFDTVFCRNVMIYFDDDTKKKVLLNLHKSMKRGAYLFIGHSESIMQYSTIFQYIQPAIYRRI